MAIVRMSRGKFDRTGDDVLAGPTSRGGLFRISNVLEQPWEEKKFILQFCMVFKQKRYNILYIQLEWPTEYSL